MKNKNRGVQTISYLLLVAAFCSSTLLARDHSVMVRPANSKELFAIPVNSEDPLCNPTVGAIMRAGNEGPSVRVRALQQKPVTDPYDDTVVIDRRIHSIEMEEETHAVQAFAQAKAAEQFAQPVEGLRAISDTGAYNYYLPRTMVRDGEIIHDRDAPVSYRGWRTYGDYARPAGMRHMQTSEVHGAATMYELLCALYQKHPDYTPAATPKSCNDEYIETAAKRADELMFWQLEGLLKEADHLRMPHEVVRGVMRAYLRSQECAGRHADDGSGAIVYEGHGIKKLYPIAEKWGSSGTTDLTVATHLEASLKLECTAEVYEAICRVRKVRHPRVQEPEAPAAGAGRAPVTGAGAGAGAGASPSRRTIPAEATDDAADEEVASVLALDPSKPRKEALNEATEREVKYAQAVGYNLEENGRISPRILQYTNMVGKAYRDDPSIGTLTEVNGKVMLDLSNKGITGVEGLESIPGIETVQILKIAHNTLDTLQPNSFSCCTSLEELYAFDCGLMALDMRTFRGCNNLRILDLSSNFLHLLYRETLTPLGATLEELYMHNNRLPEMPDLFNCRELRILDVSCNPDMKLYTERVGHVRHVLDRCRKLHTINLSNCPELKSEKVEEWFSHYETGMALRRLYLHGTQVGFAVNLGDNLPKQLEYLSLPLPSGDGNHEAAAKAADTAYAKIRGAHPDRVWTTDAKQNGGIMHLFAERIGAGNTGDTLQEEIQRRLLFDHLRYIQTRYRAGDALDVYAGEINGTDPIKLLGDFSNSTRGCCGCDEIMESKARFVVYGGVVVMIVGGACFCAPAAVAVAKAAATHIGAAKAAAFISGATAKAAAAKAAAGGIIKAGAVLAGGAIAAKKAEVVIAKMIKDNKKLEVAYFGYQAAAIIKAIIGLRTLFACIYGEPDPNRFFEQFQQQHPGVIAGRVGRHPAIVAQDALALLATPFSEYASSKAEQRAAKAFADKTGTQIKPVALGGAAFPGLHSSEARNQLWSLIEHHLLGWMPQFIAELRSHKPFPIEDKELFFQLLMKPTAGAERKTRFVALKEFLELWYAGVGNLWQKYIHMYPYTQYGDKPVTLDEIDEARARGALIPVDMQFYYDLHRSRLYAEALLNMLDQFDTRSGLRA